MLMFIVRVGLLFRFINGLIMFVKIDCIKLIIVEIELVFLCMSFVVSVVVLFMMKFVGVM